MTPFIAPATITGVRSLSDKGASVTFHTQELPHIERAKLMEYHNEFGCLAFKPSEGVYEELKVAELPDVKREGKTTSARYRAVIFVFFTQQGGKPEDFNPYYEKWMERKIEEVKNMLNQ